MVRLIVSLIIAALLPTAAAMAADGDDALRELERAVPESAAKLMGGGTVKSTLDPAEALRGVFKRAAGSVERLIKRTMSEASVVVGASILCAAASTETTGKSAYAVDLTGVMAVAAVTLTGAGSMAGTVGGAMADLSGFSKLLLTTLATASAAAGTVGSAAAKYAVSALFIDLVVSLADRLILPLILLYLAVSAASAAFGGMRGVAQLIERSVKLLLTAAVGAFTLFLSVTGLITSSADAAAVRATKTAISSLVPIVGRMISEAAETVASGAVLIRSTAGVFGMVAVAAICAMPFLELFIRSFLLKLAAAAAGTVSNAPLVGLANAVSTAYGMALALVGTTALMVFVSAAAMSMAVGA